MRRGTEFLNKYMIIRRMSFYIIVLSDIYDSRNLYCDHFRIHGIILRTLKVKLSKYQSFNNSYICIDMGIYFATYDSQIVYNQQ